MPDPAQALPRPELKIFVIMPFKASPTRNEAQLTAYFNLIKSSLEVEDSSFPFRCRVSRSDNAFNITEQIIRQISDATVVICDLSGTRSNPNVMYELGVRLSCSRGPVILVREQNANNERIFDIAGFYTYDYDPMDYLSLIEHVKSKLRAFGSGVEVFKSPVLEILKLNAPVAIRVSRERAVSFLNILEVGMLATIEVVARRMNEHLSVAGSSLRIAGGFIGVADDIISKKEELERIDWTGFQLFIAPHPSLFHFITTHYLSGLVTLNIEVGAAAEFLKYHVNYFIELSWALWPTVERLVTFVGDTQRVATLSNLLAVGLQARSQEEEFSSVERLRQEFPSFFPAPM